jgi:hypothetical protein
MLMTKALKLEIIEHQDRLYFEKGKDRIVSIEINEDNSIIKVKYDDPDWDYLIIPFNTLRSFKFKQEIEFIY